MYNEIYDVILTSGRGLLFIFFGGGGGVFPRFSDCRNKDSIAVEERHCHDGALQSKYRTYAP